MQTVMMDDIQSTDSIAEKDNHSNNESNFTWKAFREQVEKHFSKIERLHQVLGTDGDNSSLFELFTTAMNAQLHEMEQCQKKLEDDCQQRIDSIRFLVSSLKLTDDTSSLKIESPLIQCLNRLSMVEGQYMAQYDQKLSTIKEMYHKLESYCNRLGSPFVLPDFENSFLSDVSDAFTESLRGRINEAEKEIDARLEVINSFEEEILGLWSELGVEPADVPQYEQLLESHTNRPNDVYVTQELIDQLCKQKEVFSAEKEKRSDHLKSIQSEVSNLWNKLQVSPNEQSQFGDSSNINQENISLWETELEKLHQLKKEHLPIFLEDCRQQILQLWDSLFYSEEQRKSFTPMYEDIITEQVLTAHENYIKQLEAEVSANKSFLSLINRYASLIEGKKELEASSNDASRLTQRGRRDPGLLLREEKIRKRLSRELPKVQSLLIPEITAWEERNGRTFLFYDEPLLKICQEATQPKSLYRSASAAANRPKTATTTDSVNRTPSQRGRVAVPSTPSVRSASRAMTSPRTPLPRVKNTQNPSRSISAEPPSATSTANRRHPTANRIDINARLNSASRSRSANMIRQGANGSDSNMSSSPVSGNSNTPFNKFPNSVSRNTHFESKSPHPNYSRTPHETYSKASSKNVPLSPPKQRVVNEHALNIMSEKLQRTNLKEQTPEMDIENSSQNLPFSPMKISPIRASPVKTIPSSPSPTTNIFSAPLNNITNCTPMEDEWGEEGF
ncbi:antiparallel microtubule cross-linking factor Ase1 [Schizosaccharomyces pombe]|uniref:Anaphase spindle elongation protein 1 n=1 Tax=Schizosaccharomyces pombe (strain 972 / ATCC 24843) TaxID=284812 RepID=ASE1_SCHPO|nr:antiparallel microtubule cross-linking factor Ase1 [Schizosaccharomyces pombe]Q9HDY1.1 RecName: Full=Anaphase spindle elongation protein 1 [Schizosaccharomyces pombe 972h-]CAC21482.1 antiparallel microtubule cross-linking factor Ase1 [Schizosaccharomyces pombe]|eukprot:NP_593523.1 antiparallel microtubule cross-linking factor Ase1 [Schizosaccharomyces pombe]